MCFVIGENLEWYNHMSVIITGKGHKQISCLVQLMNDWIKVREHSWRLTSDRLIQVKNTFFRQVSPTAIFNMLVSCKIKWSCNNPVDINSPSPGQPHRPPPPPQRSLSLGRQEGWRPSWLADDDSYLLALGEESVKPEPYTYPPLI